MKAWRLLVFTVSIAGLSALAGLAFGVPEFLFACVIFAGMDALELISLFDARKSDCRALGEG